MSNIVPFQEMDQMADAIAKSGLFGMKDKASVLALMAGGRFTPCNSSA